MSRKIKVKIKTKIKYYLLPKTSKIKRMKKMKIIKPKIEYLISKKE